jgi:hypothetical protein
MIMPFATVHDMQRGIVRLLSAPRDLPPSAPWVDPPLSVSAASPQHSQLFEEYKDYLGDAMKIAEDWWHSLIQGHMDDGMNRDDAIEEAYAGRYAGPVSCPEIVWTLRKFWLGCDTINRTVEPAEQVPPEVLLLHWLNDGQHPQWIQVLTGMPYWPVGLDESGRWV